mgnify:CR=1 FL=1
MKLFKVLAFNPNKQLLVKSSRELVDPLQDKIWPGPCEPTRQHSYKTTCPYPETSFKTTCPYPEVIYKVTCFYVGGGSGDIVHETSSPYPYGFVEEMMSLSIENGAAIPTIGFREAIASGNISNPSVAFVQQVIYSAYEIPLDSMDSSLSEAFVNMVEQVGYVPYFDTDSISSISISEPVVHMVGAGIKWDASFDSIGSNSISEISVDFKEVT